MLASSDELAHYARLIEGFEESTGQLSLWRLYSFRDLPVELISNIYQLFVKDAASSIYTPPALVRLILEERSEEHTSELQSLMRISYAVFCLKKKTTSKQ